LLPLIFENFWPVKWAGRIELEAGVVVCDPPSPKRASQLLAATRSKARFCSLRNRPSPKPNGWIEFGGAHIAQDHLLAATTRHSPGTSNPVGDSKLRMEFSTSFQTDSRS
jgi:hypothetical protein